MPPISFFVEFQVRTENCTTEEWLDAFQGRAAAALEEEPGTYCYEALTNASKPNHVLVYERYASEAAQKAHSATPAHKAFTDALGQKRMTKRMVMQGQFKERAGFPFGAKEMNSSSTRVLFVNTDKKNFGIKEFGDDYWANFQANGPVSKTFHGEPGTDSYIFGELEKAQRGDLEDGMFSIVEAYNDEESLRAHLERMFPPEGKLNGKTANDMWPTMWEPSGKGFLSRPALTEQRRLGTQGLVCGAQGYGCMGLTAFYGKPKSDEESVALLKWCVQNGINMFDTAEAYAAKTDDGVLFNETVLGKAVKEIGRDKVVIATKHGPRQGLTKEQLRPAIRDACEASLKRLGVDTIDLYYLHRMYAKPIEIEDVMLIYKELVQEGKIKYVGLSEAPPEFIRRAHAVTPISAIQQEWSLIARDLEAKGSVVDTCRELGVGIVPYSPVARGFLSGQFQEDTPNDWRSTIPYMSAENQQTNVRVVKEIEALAASKGLTLSQLSLAWVMNKGVDVVPIPGTTSLSHLEENAMAASVKLTAAEMEAIGNAAAQIKGERGDERYMSGTFHARL
eukprot:g1238.t1